MKAQMRTGSAVLGATLVLAGSSARADEALRVAVVGSGTDGDALASVVASRLTAPATPADPDAFRASLGPTALRTMGVAAKRHDKDAELVAHMRAAARSSHADRAIVLHVEKTKKGTVVHVWLVDAQGSGSAPIDQDVRLGAGASLGDEADGAWNAVSGALTPSAEPAATSSPAAAEPAPVAAASSPADDAAAQKPPDADTGPTAAASPGPPPHSRAGSIAILGAALQGGSRHFSYVDRLTPTLRPYDLFVAPLVTIGGEIYPFVNSRVPVLPGLGATASYARAFGLASEDSGGTNVSTSWQAFSIGLRERLPIGSSFILGINAGYGDNSFEFDDPIRPAAQLPSAHYKYLRGALDGRLVRGDLSVHAGAGYLDVLSTGDMAALFPRESVGGVEAALGVADQVGSAVELSLDLVYTRFFYSLEPQPGDTYVAGGALDQMATISLGVAYLF
jgi:hypothetical protein